MSKKAGKRAGEFGPISEENWFRQSFDEDYLWLYGHRSDNEGADQVRVAVKLVSFSPGQKILDIACGGGRHMLAFAKRGARVTGIDLSPVLLKLAADKFKKANIGARFLLKDMRLIKLKDKFDGVTLWFTSFGYFPTVADDRLVLKRVTEHLKPGGWWWIDLPHPAYLEDNLVPETERRVEGPYGTASVFERRQLIGRRVIKTTRVVDSRGKRVFKEYVRLYRPEQFGAMVARVGLRVDGILGDYDGRTLTRLAPRQIWFGRKL